MLPSQPQTLFGVFASSFALYKKVFFPVMPIMIVSSILAISSNFFGEAIENPVAMILLVFLMPINLFFHFWITAFVCGFEENNRFNYFGTFLFVFKKLPRLFAITIIILSIIFLLIAILSPLYLIDNELFRLLATSVLAFCLLPFLFYFYWVFFISQLEIINQNSGIMVALKKSLSVALTGHCVKRMILFILAIILLFLLILFIFFMVAGVLYLMLIKFTPLAFVMGYIFSILLQSYFYPLMIVFYRDLMLRYNNAFISGAR